MSTNVINPPPSGGLVWSSNESPGLTRRRSGRGFCYRDPKGRLIRERNILMRIDALAIPPAWQDVWICPDPNGHIQATGRDTRGRKQYRYHPDWARERDAGKFDRIIAFGEALPTLRRRLSRAARRAGGRLWRAR